MAGSLENSEKVWDIFWWKDKLIDIIGSKSLLREMKGAAARLTVGMGERGCQGKCMDPGSGDLSLTSASAKYQLCNRGSNL